jgi:hypothetical protein
VRLRPLEERDIPTVTQLLVDVMHVEADPIKEFRGLPETEILDHYKFMANHPENRELSVVAVVDGGGATGAQSEGPGSERIVAFLLGFPFPSMHCGEKLYHPEGDYRLDHKVWTGLFEEFKT